MFWTKWICCFITWTSVYLLHWKSIRTPLAAALVPHLCQCLPPPSPDNCVHVKSACCSPGNEANFELFPLISRQCGPIIGLPNHTAVFSLSHAAACLMVQEIITVGQSSPKLVDCYVHKVYIKHSMAIQYKLLW